VEVRERITIGGVAGAFSVLALIFALTSPARAQTPAAGPAQPMISGAINSANVVTLSGNTRPEARISANDRGRVADSFAMPQMMLQLRRPAAQEQALQTLMAQQTDRNSPNFHHWLTPEQIGTQFGPAQSDIETITGWLRQQGFTVTTVYPNRMAIAFSGTAGQVRTTFHTEIHNIIARGATRFANMSDPQIPAALAPAVAGVVGLNNIPPKPQYRPVQKQYTVGGGQYALVPADLATIYNLNPVFSGGNTGQGQTIYLYESSDLYGGTSGGTNSDWSTFRSTLGLSGYTGASINTVHPGCTDPGNTGAEGEAILDAEWASAAAPSAAIVMIACDAYPTTPLNTMFADTTTYPPSVISISYGECEAALGSSTNAAFNSTFQTGAAEGWSIFVSAGDGAAAGCDDFDSALAAQDGIAVSGFASTPYNVAVGGTDFSDTYSGTTSGYWNSNNGTYYGSAKSYVPEIPWNNSCASQLLASFYSDNSTTYGSSGFCNNTTAENDGFLTISGGSGGPSTVYSKPSWQSGFAGIVSDGMRDLPDVSLFAASGVWGHYYVYCYSDVSQGGSLCTGAPSNWSGAGGTSFASPIWAGFQALINNKQGGPQGLPTPILYALAATEYGAGGSSTCNSSNGNTVGSTCVFYDVTLGDNDVPCASGSPNCYLPSGTYGVLSTSTSAYQPAYKTTTGWDFATGIGTVNVFNLVNAWASASVKALEVSVTGGGTVASSPSGINCPSACSADFSSGAQVSLTPTPVAGWVFSGWSGGCTGSGACTVTMNSPQSVVATFGQSFTLTVNDSGSGTVTSSPAGISCGSTCSAAFATGTQVTLTPAAANGWQFTSWSGACSGSGSCVVTMNAAESVTATFTQLSYTLAVSVSGNGSVTSSPGGINCPGTCSSTYLSGTPVTLTATPAGGASFSGWSGSCTGTGSCQVTMNSLQSVAATFTANGTTFLSHTWVDSAGSDTGSCDLSAPCQTFAGAFAKTSAGGEITCANSSDFGQVLITHAITIDCKNAIGSQTSLGGANTSGITIVTNSTDTVVLRGLDVDGLGLNSGTCSGGLISFSGAGTLHLQKMKINHMILTNCDGVLFAPESNSALDITDSDITDNISNALGGGVYIVPQSGVEAKVTVANTRLNGDYFGIVGDGRSGGIIQATISDSVVSGNSENGITALSAGSSVMFMIDQTKVSGNAAAGLFADGSNAGMLARNTSVSNNAIGLYSGGGGTLYSYGNNSVNGNSTNGAFTGTVGLQ
jgi:subtilase family serine protease